MSMHSIESTKRSLLHYDQLFLLVEFMSGCPQALMQPQTEHALTANTQLIKHLRWQPKMCPNIFKTNIWNRNEPLDPFRDDIVPLICWLDFLLYCGLGGSCIIILHKNFALNSMFRFPVISNGSVGGTLKCLNCSSECLTLTSINFHFFPDLPNKSTKPWEVPTAIWRRTAYSEMKC